jgi:pimeloyl-ACP methyl ester carboxylesterase
MKTRSTIVVATLALLLVVPAASAATVAGATIHWTSGGRGTQTIIFVHGWTCDDTSWNAQVPVISKNHRVITLDLPGHGRSGAPASGMFSMELFARAVEAVRAEAKVDRAVLVGHSMGTPVIRLYALMYPQRVSALVLVDGLVQVPAAGGGRGFAPPQMTGEAGLKARETMIRGMFGPAMPPPVQQHILKMMLGAPEATASGAMAATWDASQWKSDPVTVPVLAIYADRSGLANREGMKRIFPTAEYHEIPGTGHFLMMEKPDEFNRLLGAFLAKIN